MFNRISLRSRLQDARLPAEKSQRRLLMRRLLVPFVMGVVIIAIEVSDHYRLHLAQNARHSLLQDGELIREVLLFGILVPLMVGLVAAQMDRVQAEWSHMARELTRRRDLAAELNSVTQWKQLVERIVRLPGELSAANRVFLMVRRSPAGVDSGGFDLAGWWSDSGCSSNQSIPDEMLVDYRGCVNAVSEHSPDEMVCAQCRALALAAGQERYCLPLTAQGRLVAVLVSYTPTSLPLTQEQSRILTELAPEIALAIDNANRQQTEDRWAEESAAERQRIARDLHDTLGQNISYLRLKLDQLSMGQSLSEISGIRQEVDRMRQVADEAYLQVRGVIFDLQPGNSEELSDALRSQAEAIAARASFDITFYVEVCDCGLTPQMRRQILYISREALNNVEKHAGARQVDIHLTQAEQKLTLKIVDDGQGFNVRDVIGHDHYGLIIMNERALALDGLLTVASVPNQGTMVTLEVPVTPPPA